MASRLALSNFLRQNRVLYGAARGQSMRFHAGPVSAIQASKIVEATAADKPVVADDSVVKLPPTNRMEGSYHWDFERLLSVALVPLTAAAMVQGAHPVTDALIGVVLPIHCHIGFDAIITDYVPHRKMPGWNKLATWGLRIGTVLTLYGCYEINTNDVGLTELTKKVWNA
ncbi:uncharacterized protein VTP21DRAFT_10487 [Calcarisporiella thermophila]|uniref:uncharacterized protein n=1 Tax=Calcarisporiella thermophila TaxID=911321 RepID=UPI00374377B4